MQKLTDREASLVFAMDRIAIDRDPFEIGDALDAYSNIRSERMTVGSIGAIVLNLKRKGLVEVARVMRNDRRQAAAFRFTPAGAEHAAVLAAIGKPVTAMPFVRAVVQIWRNTPKRWHTYAALFACPLLVVFPVTVLSGSLILGVAAGVALFSVVPFHRARSIGDFVRHGVLGASRASSRRESPTQLALDHVRNIPAHTYLLDIDHHILGAMVGAWTADPTNDVSRLAIVCGIEPQVAENQMRKLVAHKLVEFTPDGLEVTRRGELIGRGAPLNVRTPKPRFDLLTSIPAALCRKSPEARDLVEAIFVQDSRQGFVELDAAAKIAGIDKGRADGIVTELVSCGVLRFATPTAEGKKVVAIEQLGLETFATLRAHGYAPGASATELTLR